MCEVGARGKRVVSDAGKGGEKQRGRGAKMSRGGDVCKYKGSRTRGGEVCVILLTIPPLDIDGKAGTCV